MKPADYASFEPQSQGTPAGQSPLDWPQQAGATEDVLAELGTLSRRRRRRRLGTMTTMTVAAAGILAAGLWWNRPAPAARSTNSVMSIVVVAAAHQTLPDGSTVDLKDGTDMEIVFTPAVRAITLRHGTARFQVAKNPRRPFVVTAGDITVQAVGTAFCVDLQSKSVEVIVTEDLAEKLTWLNPRLEFTGTPLEMVVMTFNQHNRRQLVLEDPDLRVLQLSGILRSDNIPALLYILESNFHIRAEYRGRDEILLHKAL
jgi:transmembrane sensor